MFLWVVFISMAHTYMTREGSIFYKQLINDIHKMKYNSDEDAHFYTHCISFNDRMLDTSTSTK